MLRMPEQVVCADDNPAFSLFELEGDEEGDVARRP